MMLNPPGQANKVTGHAAATSRSLCRGKATMCSVLHFMSLVGVGNSLFRRLTPLQFKYMLVIYDEREP